MSTATENRQDVGHAPEQNPNKDLINGLLQVAAFLTQHPELPPAHAMISLGNTFAYRDAPANDRDTLTRFAIAADGAGWEVDESVRYGDVQLKVELPGDVELYAKADLDKLGAVTPPEPVYIPVLQVCPHCGGKGGHAAGERGAEQCVTCDGRGYLVPDAPLDIRSEDFTGLEPDEVGDIPF